MKLWIITSDGSRGVFFGQTYGRKFLVNIAVAGQGIGKRNFLSWFAGLRGDLPYFVDGRGNSWSIDQFVAWRNAKGLEQQFGEFKSPSQGLPSEALYREGEIPARKKRAKKKPAVLPHFDLLEVCDDRRYLQKLMQVGNDAVKYTAIQREYEAKAQEEGKTS